VAEQKAPASRQSPKAVAHEHKRSYGLQHDVSVSCPVLAGLGRHLDLLVAAKGSQQAASLVEQSLERELSIERHSIVVSEEIQMRFHRFKERQPLGRYNSLFSNHTCANAPYYDETEDSLN
jgi:hypothetical protein